LHITSIIHFECVKFIIKSIHVHQNFLKWMFKNLTSFTFIVATLFEKSVRMRLTLPKWGLGNPPRLLEVQSSIARVKTLCIGAFFISLESYWSLNVQNGLAWPIWTSITQVMAKRKAGSQIGSLTPDHGKSRIDPIPLRAGGVWHIIGKLLMKATTSDLVSIGGLHQKL
jgi:hypothetical protein